MIFRFKYTVKESHTRVAVFAGRISSALGKRGVLTFTNEEWADFMHEAPNDWDFIEEAERKPK